MAARKYGNHIYIEGTGNTLESVCNDIADVTWIERSGTAGNYVYTVKGSGSTTREFRIRRDGELIIGNPSDFSFTESLVFAPNYSDRLRPYIDHGGALLVYGNVEIDGSNTSSYYVYARWYGKNYWRGDATYRPTLKHFRRVYWYWNSLTVSDYTHDIWDWENIDVIDSWGVTTNTYTFYFVDVRHTPYHNFKNVIFDGKPGATTGQYLGYCAIYTAWSHANEHYRITFDSCEFKHYYYASFSYYQGPYYKDCIWKENYSYGLYLYGNDRLLYYGHSHNYGDCGIKGQWFDLIDGGIFVDNYWSSSSRRDSYSAAGNMTLFKNCDFQSNYRNIYATDKATPLLWTGNTFAASRKQDPDSRTVVMWVFALELTIKDKFGWPVQGATIICRQKDGKEIWFFETDNNGRPITHPLYNNKIFLVHKEQTSYTGTSIFWSDDSNSSYHEILITKKNYETVSQRIVIDTDKVKTIYLRPLNRNRIEN